MVGAGAHQPMQDRLTPDGLTPDYPTPGRPTPGKPAQGMSDMLYAIIPAGGAGTRLWPLSRANTPKFLADLTGEGRSLIQGTLARLAPLTAGESVVVTGVNHADAVAVQLPELGADRLIVEPSPRDSMAAIGLAAAIIARRHGDVVVGSFAADHVIQDEAAFRDAVREAMRVAREGYVVTIGITPTEAATGFGYIHEGAPIGDFATAKAVDSFLEKPDVTTAERYVASGEYRWNAGMFIAKTSVLLGALATYEPELAAGIQEIAQAWDSAERNAVLARVWPTLKKIAIDHAIAEPLASDGGVAVVPVEMGWSDVGDYASLRQVKAVGDDVTMGVAPHGMAQPVYAFDSPGALVYTHSKPVAVLGVPDAVVVESDGMIFVTTTEHAQGVKSVVAELPESAR